MTHDYSWFTIWLIKHVFSFEASNHLSVSCTRYNKGNTLWVWKTLYYYYWSTSWCQKHKFMAHLKNQRHLTNISWNHLAFTIEQQHSVLMVTSTLPHPSSNITSYLANHRRGPLLWPINWCCWLPWPLPPLATSKIALTSLCRWMSEWVSEWM